MFQSDARTQANSMAVFTNWFGSFVVTLTFSAMNVRYSNLLYPLTVSIGIKFK